VTAVAPDAVFATVDLPGPPVQEIAEALAIVRKEYDRALNRAITAAMEHCSAREELARTRNALHTCERRARAAGMTVTPTHSFATLQAGSSDEAYELRKLKYRLQQSLRGSW
jgi:septation ring formation regulator EzrA